MKRIGLILILFTIWLSVALAAETVTVVRIIDGDTFIAWDGVREQPVRLIGVDTPETRYGVKARRDALEWGVTVEEVIQAGILAREFVVSVMPPGSTVTLVYDERLRDMYDRTLAYVHIPSGCLNEMLVCGGLRPLFTAGTRSGSVSAISPWSKMSGVRGVRFWVTIWKNAKGIK